MDDFKPCIDAIKLSDSLLNLVKNNDAKNIKGKKELAIMFGSTIDLLLLCPDKKHNLLVKMLVERNKLLGYGGNKSHLFATLDLSILKLKINLGNTPKDRVKKIKISKYYTDYRNSLENFFSIFEKYEDRHMLEWECLKQAKEVYEKTENLGLTVGFGCVKTKKAGNKLNDLGTYRKIVFYIYFRAWDEEEGRRVPIKNYVSFVAEEFCCSEAQAKRAIEICNRYARKTYPKIMISELKNNVDKKNYRLARKTIGQFFRVFTPFIDEPATLELQIKIWACKIYVNYVLNEANYTSDSVAFFMLTSPIYEAINTWEEISDFKGITKDELNTRILQFIEKTTV